MSLASISIPNGTPEAYIHGYRFSVRESRVGMGWSEANVEPVLPVLLQGQVVQRRLDQAQLGHRIVSKGLLRNPHFNSACVGVAAFFSCARRCTSPQESISAL